MKKIVKTYLINQSPLYKLRTPSKLVKILAIKPKKNSKTKYINPHLIKIQQLTIDDLEFFANNDSKNYKIKLIEDKKGKQRETEVPNPALKLLHTKIGAILSRIEPPAYLYSATKNRSYVDNAKQHATGEGLFRIDIKKFFPNTLNGYVYNFFRNVLKCEKHVATILAKLCTFNGHIPTGSPLSPILSFYAHKPMFDKIYRLALEHECVMTLYIDDIHISGAKATPKLMWEVAKIIYNHGLRYHKVRVYQKGDVKRVTGAIIVGSEIKVRNRTYKAIYEGMIALNTVDDPNKKLKALRSLIGKVNEAKQMCKLLEGKSVYLYNYKRNLEKTKV